MKERITIFLLTFSIITALMLPISAALPSYSDTTLYDRVIRLHVIGASDSEDDQAQKLRVRDGILDTVASLLDGVDDRAAAEAILNESLALIEAAANAVLLGEGSAHTARVTLTKEVYPTRVYEDYTLPAGTYTSLRVLIGKAEGQNWWCVLFPKLCITTTHSPAIIDETALIEAGLTPSQVRIITGDSPDIVIKFRLLEFIGRLISRRET